MTLLFKLCYLMVAMISQVAVIHLGSVSAQDEPKIQVFQFPSKLEVNDKASVVCMLKRGKPPYVFRWYKDGKEIKNGDSVTIQSTAMLSTIAVDPVTQMSAGNYTCIVSSSKGMDSHSSVLTVTSSPVWEIEPHDIESVVGESFRIECAAFGSPIPKVTWRKKGTESIFMPAVTEHQRNLTLFFNPVNEEHVGEYICVADNGIGEVLKKKVTVIVHEYGYRM